MSSMGHRKFLVIISCFTFHYLTATGLQQEKKWVHINFDRRDLTSARKSHPSPDNYWETFVFKGTLMQIWKSANVFVFIWK